MKQSPHADDRVPFLTALPESVWADLQRLGSPRRYTPREVLIREGDSTRDLILLHEGIVKVTARTDGGRDALLEIRIEGDVVGEIAATDHRARSATVTACGDVVATVIPQGDLLPFLAAAPDASMALYGLFGTGLRRAGRRLLDFAGHPVKVRLARVLVELVTSYGCSGGRGELMIRVNLTQEEFAALTGSTKDTVQKALAQLREDGLISTGTRRTTIRDLDRLRQQARLA
ncbi:Crp/Fnr family transcriptional regulator [Streptomyces sp. NPDC020192]|uniref:Crp/Fnr family transcriptional regulator n=1 Tax=Streptomyces sp. NPDC020192 TaxID=3365066 RepID=UPI003794801C